MDANAVTGDGPLGTRGMLDPAFGDNGVAIFENTVHIDVVDVARRASGFVMCGRRSSAGMTRITLVGVTANGQLDTTLGVGGVLELGPGTSNHPQAMIASSNRFVIAAEVYVDDVVRSQAALLLLDHDGNLIVTFDGDGVMTYGPNGYDMATQVRFAPTGLLVASTFDYDTSAARVHTALVDFAGNITQPITEDLAATPDEAITDVLGLTGGYAAFGYTDAGTFVIRYTASGARVATFAANGLYQTTDRSWPAAAGQLQTGELALASVRDSNGLIRMLSATGTLLRETPSVYGDTTQLVAIATGHATGFVAAGHVQRAGATNGLIARFHLDGTPDTSFGSDGAVEIDLGGDEDLKTVKFDVDGAIIAAGNSGTRAFLVRVL